MFAELADLPPDPILGLTTLFAADPRAQKIDLGVGVFRTADNRTPVLASVKEAEARVMAGEQTKVYTAPEGPPGFSEAVAALLFGGGHEALNAKRVAAIQTAGGCGALRIGAELLKRASPRAVYVGAPTWANHTPLFAAAGHEIWMVPYYDRMRSSIEFDNFLEAIDALRESDALLLHGPCHNPTGADLSRDQIDAVIDVAARRSFLPFIDMAYHGFAEGLEEDAYIVRAMARRVPEMLVSYSCSKNFGIYRERTGALVVVGDTEARARAMRSHAINVTRAMYSLPPAHGGAIVAEILGSRELSAEWRGEADAMRRAIKESRRLLVRTAAELQMPGRFDFIETQNGMFSLLPLTEPQVLTMRQRHGVYIVSNGRVNVCGINAGNVEHLCEALADVLRET